MALIQLAVIVGLWIWVGPFVSALVRNGFLDQGTERRVTVDTAANLKRVHQAIMLYAESEGVLPEASGWMDAAWTRLKTGDMSEEEAKKLLKTKEASQEGEYGFAFNEALSRKDPFAEDQAKILVFEAKPGPWNQAGPPPSAEKLGARKAISLAGDLVGRQP